LSLLVELFSRPEVLRIASVSMFFARIKKQIGQFIKLIQQHSAINSNTATTEEP
jgi:hypothetical protein